MKLYISYFYQIRNFNKYMIPLSTAMWDPKWFHEGEEPTHLFWDKNGVINGLRCQDLIFNSENYQDWCSKDCDKDPLECEYLKQYKEQIYKCDFNKLLDMFKEVIMYVANHNKDLKNIDKYNICLIIYETPHNRCSERIKLIEYFKTKNCDLLEWSEECLEDSEESDNI